MLKVTDKGTKTQLILDSSSSESDSDEGHKNVGKSKFVDKAKPKANRKTGSNFSEEFTINKGYAERYDNWRNLEEMQKLKNRLGINDISELKEDESSSESSSEEEEEWSAEKEKAFLKTLACLKTKNPKIYSDEFGFFKNAENALNGTESPAEPSKRRKADKKPFTVRDHERTMILEKGGQESEDDNDDENGSHEPKSYPEELASIKTEFSKALNEIDSSDEEDGLLGSNLLKRRANKSSEDKQREDEEYKRWLKGELEKVDKGKLSKEDIRDLKSLREYWNDDKLDEGEKFLRDYILNKKYIDPLKAENDYIPSYNEVVHDDDELSNDEKFEAEREEFEHKYNFRFEEPDQDFIKRYPRTIQESMRREDTKRKEQRQKAKDRKEELKARTKEEVQRLKALKRKEIMDKIQKLHEIAGDPNLNLSEIDIDGDFDPEEYDRRMQEIFNDDYYQEGADDEKPVFDFDPAIDEEDENWEEWVPARRDGETLKEELEETDDDENEDDNAEHKKEEAEIVGRRGRRAATEKELIEASKGKRGRKKRSVFLDALEREKPKFDPKFHKSFEKYFEEYYHLDFEDVIGDVKCRFKYHKTTPNDFGLTTEEILKAQDKELNQWASLKKTFQYRGDDEEQYEVQAYKKKAEREDLKKRVLLSVYQPTEEKDEDENDDEENNVKQKKKKKKNKKKNATPSSNEKIKIESDEVKETSPKKSPQKVSTTPAKVKKTVPSLQTKPQSKKREATQSSPDTTVDTPSTPKLSKRQRKNRKKLSRPENGEAQKESNSPAKQEKSPKKHKGEFKNNKSKQHFDKDKRGTKRKAENSNETNGVTLDEDRLRSYGLNPKKFKKQMKYGNSAAKL